MLSRKMRPVLLRQAFSIIVFQEFGHDYYECDAVYSDERKKIWKYKIYKVVSTQRTRETEEFMTAKQFPQKEPCGGVNLHFSQDTSCTTRLSSCCAPRLHPGNRARSQDSFNSAVTCLMSRFWIIFFVILTPNMHPFPDENFCLKRSRHG